MAALRRPSSVVGSYRAMGVPTVAPARGATLPKRLAALLAHRYNGRDDP
jgi:hypothetical protein